MATSSPSRGERRSLLALLLIIVVLAGGLAAGLTWGSAQTTPLLGLDLKGGTQMILSPQLAGGQTVTTEQVAQARDIIVQRVDANGVSGAEVTTEGGNNVVVSMPGVPDQATLDAIQKSSRMEFRGVLMAGAGIPATATPTPTGTSTPAPTGTATPASTATSSPTSAKGVVPPALKQVTPSPSGTTGATTASPSGTSQPTPSPTATSGGSGATPDPNSEDWITAAILADFNDLNCSNDRVLNEIVDDPAKPMVTCSSDRAEKYILGPVIVGGESITDASAGYKVNQNGTTSNEVVINLSFGGDGKSAYAKASETMVTLPDPRNRMAAVLDKRVIVAPSFRSAIPDGNAQITGNFTIEEARSLAQELKFGALPISFELNTQTRISPTLGTEQLRLGLLAGVIGLLLVVGYSLLQYRALGLVTVASLLIAATLTYLAVALLGWGYNYRLDMAGVTGLIVAIGITADSFIVYFERIRDEVREGRALRSAVETGWARARRTIIAADAVNFLAAAVLYSLASANVRGFAFTLGLTTIIDLVVVALFTHPTVALLSGTKFFAGGHPLSGLDPKRLGAKTVRYAGRGRVSVAQSRHTTVGEEGAVL
ncbi:MAG: protein translocase subunit SecD [Nostocoides sp.]